MKLEMYSVYDSVVGAWMQPIFMRSKGEAIRSFSDAVNDSKSQFSSHVSDYSIWYIGAFNDQTGDLEFDGQAVKVVTGVEVVRPPQ